MKRMLVIGIVAAATFVAPGGVLGQTGDGSLRGYVKDEQGGVLPGVTVAATGPELIAPVVAVTDSAGYYRLNNLPPGTFTITAELTGFGTYRREGIVMRAGSTFTADIELKVGSLSETVTVTGESPMVETSKPTSTLTIQGELVRAAPITSRRLFSDVLDMAPGVASRNVDDGVGRRAYYFHGAVLFSHVFTLEGAPASSFNDAAAHSMGMGGDTIADTELKLGGVDASAPMGTGIVMNIVAPEGGNRYKGSATYEFQPRAWNDDNTRGGSHPGGIPTVQSVNQVDLSLGGPIVRDKTWFFADYRYADLTNGISRTPMNLSNLKAFSPGFQPFDNIITSKQPFIKVTSQINQKHQFSAFYQRDRLVYTTDRELDASRFNPTSTGGGLLQGKLNSVWGNKLTTQISGSFNNKGGADASTYSGLQIVGPQVIVHQDAFTQSGTQVGTGGLVQLNNPQSLSIQPASMLVFRGDVTYFTEGWGGSHEIKAGIWAEPRAHRDSLANYVNNGFVLQEVRQLDPQDPAAGTSPFHLRYRSPSAVPAIDETDRDVAAYLQDSWRPYPRLTASLGLRVDWIRRHDNLLNFDRERSTAVQPRVGIAYLVTDDARNVLRASYSRLYDQVNGRDYIVTFGTTGAVTTTDVYIDRTGRQTTILTPPTRSVSPSLLFDPTLHQPWLHEFVVGFRRQFPAQFSADIGFTRRYYHDNFGEVDINGIYPSGPNQPFGGFGLVDPNQGIIYQERNSTWTHVVVTNVEGTLAKNMSHNFQLVLSYMKQWQHLEGTWNPTDPARFIQPGAFPDNKDLSTQLFGNGDQNTLSGGGRESGAAYRPYALRFAGQYFAPLNFSVAASYVIEAGGYVGTVVDKLPSADPVFGPPTVRLANGSMQPNPLATTIRFACPTRSDCQTINDTARYLQLHVGRVFKLNRHQFEPAINIFDVFNTGAYTQWDTGANDRYSPNYLAVFNRHPPRAFQITAAYRF
jgi:hypothetical protein